MSDDAAAAQVDVLAKVRAMTAWQSGGSVAAANALEVLVATQAPHHSPVGTTTPRCARYRLTACTACWTSGWSSQSGRDHCARKSSNSCVGAHGIGESSIT